MKKVIATCLMLLALTGCTYSLTLMSREDGETGYGTASNSGSQNGPISITPLARPTRAPGQHPGWTTALPL
jgi:hypothetical protein